MQMLNRKYQDIFKYTIVYVSIYTTTLFSLSRLLSVTCAHQALFSLLSPRTKFSIFMCSKSLKILLSYDVLITSLANSFDTVFSAQTTNGHRSSIQVRTTTLHAL